MLPLHNNDLDDLPEHPGLRRATTTSASTTTASYALLSPEDTAQRLRTSLSIGLSPAEAQSRLHKDGPNELPHEEEEPLWMRFLKQFKETLILLLLASAVVSFFIGGLAVQSCSISKVVGRWSFAFGGRVVARAETCRWSRSGRSSSLASDISGMFEMVGWVNSSAWSFM